MLTLKRYRISLNMSKAELASKARISKTHINNIERNQSFPSMPVLKRIAKVLQVCPYDLINFCIECPLENCCKDVLMHNS